MKYAKYILFAIMIMTALTIMACSEKEQDLNEPNEPVLGGDTDEYGCKPSAGYSWCPSLNECVRVWETLCPEYEEHYREPGMCTREYMPVTGELVVPTTEGQTTITKTFGNRCEAETAGATNIQLVNNVEIITVTNFEECISAGNPAMESFPRACIHEGQYFQEQINYEELNLPKDKYEACQEIEGTPLLEFNECEYISEEACEYLGGEFLECESACRNDPDAEYCTMQCVQVCRFN